MKISGTWASLLRGVSQQAPESRQAGQHAEQVNMLSDPVAGLTRRRGTVRQAGATVFTANPVHELSMLYGAAGYRKVEHSAGGKDYILLLQSSRPDSLYSVLSYQSPPPIVCYNLTDKVFVPLATDAVTQARVTEIGRQGVQAVVSLGKYLVHSLRGESLTSLSADRWGASTNNAAVVWVRGGAYGRKYEVNVSGGASFSYSTPPAYSGGATLTPVITTIAAVEEVLGPGGAVITPAVAASATITSVKVDAGGSGYKNGAKVSFVGNPEATSASGFANVVDGVVMSVTLTSAGANYTSVAAVVETVDTGALLAPQAIAEQLRVAGIAAGYSIERNGSHLLLHDTSVGISASDGGDGSLLRAVSHELDSIDKLPIMAANGHIVKIIVGPSEWYYMEAFAKDATLAIGEVVWRECAGYVQGNNIAFNLITVEGGTVRAGPSNTIDATEPPQLVASMSGDATSNPAPAFLLGLPITYLGLFQDRLLVGAGAALAVSAAGDYFNFFRSSVVTVPVSDPFEMIAQGSEDDTLRYSVPYNRNLVIFGDRRQYVISGATALTVTSANMSVMTTYADAATTAPLAAGGQIYYARNREGNVGLHQIQPGAYVDSAESFPASAQIGDYIKAPAAQLEVVPGAPSLLLVRSGSVGNGLTTFSFLDTPEGRKQDAWSRWEFAPECGYLLSVKSTPDGVLLIWLRKSVAGVWWLVCDLLPMATSVGAAPFLDSMRRLSDVEAGSTEVTSSATDAWTVALDGSTERFLIGMPFSQRTQLIEQYPAAAASATVGLSFPSYVELTNPFMRDSGQQAILEGRLVISRLNLNMKDSGGLTATVTSGGVSTDYTFNARVIGSLLNAVGRVPVVSGSHLVSIGRETREYKVKLAANKWFPFTLVGIGWVGQSFNRTPRA